MDFSPSGSNSLYVVLQSRPTSAFEAATVIIFLWVKRAVTTPSIFIGWTHGSRYLLSIGDHWAQWPMFADRQDYGWNGKRVGIWTLLVDYAGGQNYPNMSLQYHGCYLQLASSDMFLWPSNATTRPPGRTSFSSMTFLVEPLFARYCKHPCFTFRQVLFQQRKWMLFFDENLDEMSATEPAHYQHQQWH